MSRWSREVWVVINRKVGVSLLEKSVCGSLAFDLKVIIVLLGWNQAFAACIVYYVKLDSVSASESLQV